MTRRIVYGISLWVFLAATALTFTAIALPNWISYTSPTTHDPIRVSYGLHKRCTNIPSGPAQLQTSGTRCTSFPQYEDCHGEDRYFCSIWRTTGFLMNFAVVLELASLVGFAVVILGGRGKREAGWQILSGVIGLVAAAQMIAMALVAFLYDHDNRFFVGWELDKSWILCTVSWAVMALDAIGIIMAALLLPSEGDYELIPDPH